MALAPSLAQTLINQQVTWLTTRPQMVTLRSIQGMQALIETSNSSQIVSLDELEAACYRQITNVTPSLPVAGPLRARESFAAHDDPEPVSGPMCGGTDPNALDPFQPDGSIDEEILTEIFRQLTAEDPAVAAAALTALTNGWTRAYRDDCVKEFGEKVASAQERVRTERVPAEVHRAEEEENPAAPARPAAGERSAPTPAVAAAPSPRGSGGGTPVAVNSGGAALAGNSGTVDLSSGGSLNFVSAPGESMPFDMAVIDSPRLVMGTAPDGASLPVLHAATADTGDEDFAPGVPVPALLVANSAPIPLTDFSVDEVPIEPTSAVTGLLRGAENGVEYLAILLGSQAGRANALPFLQAIVSRPELRPLAEATGSTVAHALGSYVAATGLGTRVPGVVSPTATLVFHYEPATHQYMVYARPSGHGADAVPAMAFHEDDEVRPRRWPVHGSGMARYCARMSYHSYDDTSLPFGTPIGVIQVPTAYLGTTRLAAPSFSVAMLARREGAATDRALADITADTGSTDHQSGEGGSGNHDGYAGGGRHGRGRDRDEDEAYAAA